MPPQTQPQLANAQTPQLVTPTPTFQLDVPNTIPSTALNQSLTYNDVLARRNRSEKQQQNSQLLNQAYTELFSRIQQPAQATPFSNPEQFLNRLLLNQPTEIQTQLDTARQNQANAIGGFADTYDQARTDAREQFDVTGLTAELGETRNRIAERTKQFREDLRAFEVNAEQRGVSREFVDAERRKLQADATAELADLSIIEAAQTGNLQLANDQVDDVLEELRIGFELENQSIEAEIKRLEAIDTREASNRAEQLQIALGERERNIQVQLENEREKRQYMVDAAANGADQGTLQAIRNAATPGEAAVLAGPWVGRLQRMQAEASIANIYDQIASRRTALREQQQAAQTEEEKKQAQKEADTESALEISALANELANSSGLGAAVGFGFGKSVRGRIPFVSGDAIEGTDRADFEATAERLANLLTLDNLDLMSGVLSETDIRILETAGSNLRNFNQSEDQYRQEIGRIQSVMQRTINNNGLTPEQAQFYGIFDAGDTDVINSIWSSL